MVISAVLVMAAVAVIIGSVSVASAVTVPVMTSVVAVPAGVSVSMSPDPEPDTVAVPNVSVRFGALVPRRFANLLAPGKHLASDPASHAFMREIPQCWLTGQAAGVAAAQAAASGADLRTLPLAPLRAALRSQGVVLRGPVDAPPARAGDVPAGDGSARHAAAGPGGRAR